MNANAVTVEAIQSHYDRLSPLYRRLWGEHIHHGFWKRDETARQAQVALVERLATEADLHRRSYVLDVGCGLGGSAIWLARELDCSVLGLTISRVQLEIARQRARETGLSDRVHFRLEDANSLQYTEEFDVVWVIECSEHLFDKSGFIRNAAAALRPGGMLALCAWLKSDGPGSEEHREIVNRVCRGMLCPSLASRSEYCSWMEAAGLRVRKADDITHGVSRTWDLCLKLSRLPFAQRILRSASSDTLKFVESFTDIARAYAKGAMSYGMFAAVK